MATGRIILGAKELSRKSLSSGQLEGFFYGGGRGGLMMGKCLSWLLITKHYCSRPTARQHLIFYDNPSQKRVARCTKIPHTGALLTVKGVGQRLRKGFQKWWRGKIVPIRLTRNEMYYSAQSYRSKQNYPDEVIQIISCLLFESLSSAAELRHSARNTTLWDTDLCVA